ncbi:MAG TPA: hypothetical protein P5270_07955 [Victivallales bacterium]|nr:hypothetical protein [Victivallales bacterium]
MEIIVNSRELDSVLNCVSKILPSKSSMEILSGILIEGKDELSFISTDLENTIKVSLKCQFKKGSILIPGKQFISFSSILIFLSGFCLLPDRKILRWNLP